MVMRHAVEECKHTHKQLLTKAGPCWLLKSFGRLETWNCDSISSQNIHLLTCECDWAIRVKAVNMNETVVQTYEQRCRVRASARRSSARERPREPTPLYRLLPTPLAEPVPSAHRWHTQAHSMHCSAQLRHQVGLNDWLAEDMCVLCRDE